MQREADAGGVAFAALAASGYIILAMGTDVDAKATLQKMHEIDALFDKVRKRLILLKREAVGSDELLTLRDQVESIHKDLSVARTEQQDMELESRSLTDRIRESEHNLMSGALGNPRELEALQASIDSMKVHRTDLENSSVDRLVKVDSLEGSLAEKQTSLDEMERQWAQRMSAIDKEMDQRKKEYVYLRRAREQVSNLLTAEHLELYDHLRRRKNGVAVAQLEDEVCGACHTQVAIGILDSVRYSDELLNCPSCGRILLTVE